MQMPYCAAQDGTRLWFEDQGSGPTIIFAHEFGGDLRSWDLQVNDLTAHFRCVRFAARGFHPSDSPGSVAAYGQRLATSDLLHILDFLDITRAHIVGTSMGSFTSLDFALEHCERVRSLTLIGNSSGPRTEAERETYRSTWLQPEIDHRQSCGAAGAVTHLDADPAYVSFKSSLPDAWHTYTENLASQSVDGALSILRTLHWDRRSLWDDDARLRDLSAPVLLLHGDQDYYLVTETNAYLASVLPQVTLKTFCGVGHLVNIEKPREVNQLLRDHFTATELGLD